MFVGMEARSIVEYVNITQIEDMLVPLSRIFLTYNKTRSLTNFYYPGAQKRF
jgi:hypothetical protein